MKPDSYPPQSVIDAFVGAAHGDFNTVKSLSSQYPLLVKARATWNELAIEAAAQTARVDIAEFLLSAGAELDICTAVMLDRRAVVQKLLQEDPTRIQARGAHNLPLLYFAAITGNIDLAGWLLERGALLNAGDGANTPLHGAVLFEQVQMAGWLLERGAEAGLHDYNRKTPLDLATASKNAELVSMFKRQAQIHPGE